MNPSSSTRVSSAPTLADALDGIDCGADLRAAMKAGDIAVFDMSQPTVTAAVDARRARQAPVDTGPSPKTPRGPN